MLPARHRLGSSFFRKKNLYKVKTFETSDLKFKILKNEGLFKTAVVISKKVAPKATDRNRIKRIIMNILKEELNNLKGEVVIIVKNNIASYKLSDLKEKQFKKFLQSHDS